MPLDEMAVAARTGAANAVVALNGSASKVVWSFQMVHHNIWDYDLPAQPSLLALSRNGQLIDVVAQVTKTGFMSVLERDMGKPFFGVEARAVPFYPGGPCNKLPWLIILWRSYFQTD